MLKIDIIPALNDNYIYMLIDEETGETACVDPGEAKPVIDYLNDKNLTLDYILNTHHHWDHTNGNQKLKKKYKAKLAAPAADNHRIKDIDFPLVDGDTFVLGASIANVLAVPGHTTGHITFHFEQSMAAFTGDTLFSLGCGRMFEGTAEQMWASLCKLRDLPDNTQIYCGHEYTADNGRFCLSLDPHNPFLQRRMEGVKRLRDNNRPTIPSLMGIEKSANIFLRADKDEIKQAVGMTDSDPVDVFAELRTRKDNF